MEGTTMDVSGLEPCIQYHHDTVSYQPAVGISVVDLRSELQICCTVYQLQWRHFTIIWRHGPREKKTINSCEIYKLVFNTGVYWTKRVNNDVRILEWVRVNE